jgi:hypothetical protein
MTGINKLSAVVATIFLTAALGLSACDSSTVDTDTTASLDESSGELMSVLVADIGLTSTQQAQVAAMFEKHGDAQHEPGFLWPVAADLQQRLTDEQKQRLFDKAPGRASASGSSTRAEADSADRAVSNTRIAGVVTGSDL